MMFGNSLKRLLVQGGPRLAVNEVGFKCLATTPDS